MRKNLLNARKLTGKTQKEIAKNLGISEVYYRKIEAGERTGSVHIWDSLEKLLKTPQQILRTDSIRVQHAAEKTN